MTVYIKTSVPASTSLSVDNRNKVHLTSPNTSPADGLTVAQQAALAGMNASATELNYLVGVTGPIQDQLDGKIGNSDASAVDQIAITNASAQFEVKSARPEIIRLLGTSDVSMSTQKIVDVALPTLPNDAATKDYVDTAVGALSSGVASSALDMNGFALTNSADPTDEHGIGDRGYNDARYAQLSLNLGDLPDVDAAKTNLALHGVATSGEYTDLNNRVVSLDDLSDVQVGSPTALEDGHALTWHDTSGTFRLSTSPTTSVFGRSGAVVATVGDYDATQVAFTRAGWTATTVDEAITEIGTGFVKTDGSSQMTGSLDLNGNRVRNLPTPQNSDEPVTFGMLEDIKHQGVLGSLTGINLLSAADSTVIPLFVCPPGQKQIVTSIIIEATTVTHSGSAIYPVVSLGTQNPDYDNVMDATTINFGGRLGSNLVQIAEPRIGASSVSAGSTYSLYIDSASGGGMTDLLVNIYVVGIEF